MQASNISREEFGELLNASRSLPNDAVIASKIPTIIKTLLEKMLEPHQTVCSYIQDLIYEDLIQNRLPESKRCDVSESDHDFKAVNQLRDAIQLAKSDNGIIDPGWEQLLVLDPLTRLQGSVMNGQRGRKAS